MVAAEGERRRRPYVGPASARTCEEAHTPGNCTLHTLTVYHAPGVSQEVLVHTSDALAPDSAAASTALPTPPKPP